MRMIIIVAAIIVNLFYDSVSVHAQQSISCGIAQHQLQGYVNQVNNIANFEFSQGIPMRCGFNGQCTNWLLFQLNSWYSQQTQLVNVWYQKIAIKCTSDSSPGRIEGSIEEPIEEDAIDEMVIDDEDKTVKIKIPKNPNGFSPKN
jgi:hypothetical protein